MKRIRLLAGLAVAAVAQAACSPAVPPIAQPAPVASASPTPSTSSIAVEYPAPEQPASACQPLAQQLRTAPDAERAAKLDAIRDQCGGEGLVAALGTVERADPEREFSQLAAIFTMIDELADPRAADALERFLATKPSMHWRTLAAIALASIGDVRAAPVLAERLLKDTVALYGNSKLVQEQALARTDSERIVAARVLADLATIHPDKRPWLLEQTERAVLTWLEDGPVPHANGLRFLAIAGSPKALPLLRELAFPKGALPAEGQQPPMPQEWVTAQIGLRYLGRTRDATSWAGFEKQLDRRRVEAHDVDVTMAQLMAGGRAILGMSVRALGVGVADGYAEWGDPRAYPILTKYIESKRENEQSRMAACHALGWVTPDDKVAEAANKIASRASSRDEAERFVASCYASSLTRRSRGEASDKLVALIASGTNAELRGIVAEAVGKSGLNGRQTAALRNKLHDRDPGTAVDAATALLLGATPAEAAAAVVTLGAASDNRLEQLRERYPRAFGYWSDEDLSSGRMARWAVNAEAASGAMVKGESQEWVREAFGKALADCRFDNGPHSVTAVVLRYRLLQQASGGSAAEREQARLVLRMMKARGALMALSEN